MEQQFLSFEEQGQAELETYLLESAVLKPDQLSVAKKIQARQEGPLLMILLQLSFIDLQQFITLLDWNVNRLVQNQP